MTSCTNQELLADANRRHVVCSSPCEKKVSNENSFDPEFSLPCGFFTRDFLDSYNISEPHPKERMQLENDLFH